MENLFPIDSSLGNKFCKNYIKRAWKLRSEIINTKPKVHLSVKITIMSTIIVFTIFTYLEVGIW
jgi:hypothetical protein